MASVYILYSKKLTRYYTGSCEDLSVRIKEHSGKKYTQSYTSKADDWELYFEIPELSYSQARRIELHIKKMKSKKYIENLKRYPDISRKLIQNYK